MKTAIAYHIYFNHHSSARLLGTTVGEIFKHFNNAPPDRLTLYEIDKLQGLKLKNGDYDCRWFNSPIAQVEPVLSHNVDELLQKITVSLDHSQPNFWPQWEDLQQSFRTKCPASRNFGNVVEVLRILNYEYPHMIGEFSDFINKLSDLNFFNLR